MTTRDDIFTFAEAELGTAPEYLWAKYPDHAVLRHPGSRKWYALVMDIPRGKAGLSGEGKIDVVDLKCGPLLLGSLLGKEGYFPAYHMNKQNWIGVRLDGSVSREDLCWLLRTGCDLAGGKKTRRPRDDRATDGPFD